MLTIDEEIRLVKTYHDYEHDECKWDRIMQASGIDQRRLKECQNYITRWKVRNDNLRQSTVSQISSTVRGANEGLENITTQYLNLFNAGHGDSNIVKNEEEEDQKENIVSTKGEGTETEMVRNTSNEKNILEIPATVQVEAEGTNVKKYNSDGQSMQDHQWQVKRKDIDDFVNISSPSKRARVSRRILSSPEKMRSIMNITQNYTIKYEGLDDTGTVVDTFLDEGYETPAGVLEATVIVSGKSDSSSNSTKDVQDEKKSELNDLSSHECAVCMLPRLSFLKCIACKQLVCRGCVMNLYSFKNEEFTSHQTACPMCRKEIFRNQWELVVIPIDNTDLQGLMEEKDEFDAKKYITFHTQPISHSCPICNLSFLGTQIEEHVNVHFR